MQAGLSSCSSHMTINRLYSAPAHREMAYERQEPKFDVFAIILDSWL